MTLIDQLDELLRAKDRAVCTAIDAGACQTDSDFRRAHEALEQYETLRDAFEKRLERCHEG